MYNGRSVLLHRAIYETFNDIELNDNMVINHKDHNRDNNNINNLEAIS